MKNEVIALHTLKPLKTLKALKNVTIFNCIFCISWLVSIICLYVYNRYDVRVFLDIGVLSVYGWMVNPLGLIFCYRALKAYLSERKDPAYKQMIGKRWIWILIWPVITTVIWVIGGGLFVLFTGGV